ncbi:MAG TPA: homoserine kinase [Blastocatellia bacterium]|nr:homoserine kinase [Blastocatellia bacterium]
MPKTEIRIPGSTSNLGASFDACGLALGLYLTVRVEPHDGGFDIELSGEVSNGIPRDETNLILKVARRVASRRGTDLKGARMEIDSQIPLARGLGSSSSAIIAGLSVYETLTGDLLTQDESFRCALEFEEHGDNLAPGMLGGLVVACVTEKGDERSLLAVKRHWPDEIKIVLAIPDFEMNTTEMRRALPESVSIADAVFNLQRAALFQAIVSERRFDLFAEALRDRLHQPYRIPRVRGLGEVLKLNDEIARFPGLLGVAMSGAGSTMIAFAFEGFDRIEAEMRDRLNSAGVSARTMRVDVDNQGRHVTEFGR